MALPQFFIIGAPKAGTTALHAALAPHPQLFMSPVKETKYYLTDGKRPSRRDQQGPGDAHSAQEWIWRRDRFEALFAHAPGGALRGESTPFYLYDRQAHRRIAADVPGAKLVALLRDPVDRAYSNWMHLRSDGLEPVSDFVEAFRREPQRVARGWAPFWHYRGQGLYGEQLRDLYQHFPRENVHLVRYRELVDNPRDTVDAVCRFLGVATGAEIAVRPENVKPFVAPSIRTTALSRAVRAGAWVGSFAPPQVWRRASEPLLSRLHRDGVPRPQLTPDVRDEVRSAFRDDVALLETVTGRDFSDWLQGDGRGAFVSRQNASG